MSNSTVNAINSTVNAINSTWYFVANGHRAAGSAIEARGRYIDDKYWEAKHNLQALQSYIARGRAPSDSTVLALLEAKYQAALTEYVEFNGSLPYGY